MGPTWGSPGPQVAPKLATWTLLSGFNYCSTGKWRHPYKYDSHKMWPNVVSIPQRMSSSGANMPLVNRTPAGAITSRFINPIWSWITSWDIWYMLSVDNPGNHARYRSKLSYEASAGTCFTSKTFIRLLYWHKSPDGMSIDTDWFDCMEYGCHYLKFCLQYLRFDMILLIASTTL